MNRTRFFSQGDTPKASEVVIDTTTAALPLLGGTGLRSPSCGAFTTATCNNEHLIDAAILSRFNHRYQVPKINLEQKMTMCQHLLQQVIKRFESIRSKRFNNMKTYRCSCITIHDNPVIDTLERG